MKLVASGGQYNISSGELYLGDKGYPFGSHARGWNLPRLGGNIIQFHNGHLSAHQNVQHIERQWKAFSSPKALKTIMQHEFGHAAFSFPHSNDRNCVMHINGNRDDFCPAEANWLKSRYG
jgi:hypothetical protein